MNDADNPYSSPKAEIASGKVDTTTHEVVHKVGENTYQWENRIIRISAEPVPWLNQFAPLFVQVDESQKFERGRSDQISFFIYLDKRVVPIQVDFVISFVPWKKKFNLFIGEDFIDHSAIYIQRWWLPWVFSFIMLVAAIMALGLRAAIRSGRLS